MLKQWIVLQQWSSLIYVFKTLPISHPVYAFKQFTDMKQSTELLQHRWISESTAHVSFVPSFYWVLSSIIAEAVKISPVFYCFTPSAIQTSLWWTLRWSWCSLSSFCLCAGWDWVPHYHEILINPLHPPLCSPTLIPAMRLNNPMIRLIIWSQIWAWERIRGGESRKETDRGRMIPRNEM